MLRKLGALAGILAVAAAPVPAAAQARCTQETLNVRGIPVSIGYCVAGAPRATGTQEVVVPVVATYGAPGGSLRRSTEFHFLAGERVSRVLEDLDLGPLGISGTLHLALDYAGGVVRIEGALLTPGAITVK